MSAPDLRLGRYQDVLADVECDAVICDPPYGARTHASVGARDPSTLRKASKSKIAIDYTSWSAEDVSEFVESWSPRCRGWIVALTSHDLINAWTEAFDASGRYSFAPVPCVMRGMSIRLQGDGPSSWSVYAMVARPRARRFATWGSLPGAYDSGRSDGGGGRGKPLDLMRALVKDYSRPGGLICDPTAGYGTTGVAALGMGRRFVGSEVDAAAFGEAGKRLAGAQVVDLFDPERAKQAPLFAEPPRATRRKKAA